MTDVFVESTYKSLILAYKSNDKVKTVIYTILQTGEKSNIEKFFNVLV